MAIKGQFIPEGTNDFGEVIHLETTASQVKLADANNNFISTDVEGAMNELFQNVSNGKDLIATSITDKGVITSGSDTFSTMATKIGQIPVGINTDDATAVAGDLLSGKTAYKAGEKLTGTIPSKSSQTYTPKTTNQTIAAGQYLSGAQTILGDADLVASNIRSGVNIFGVIGNLIDGTGTKKFAQGNIHSSGSQYAYVQVSGLGFTPRIVYAHMDSSGYRGSSGYSIASYFNIYVDLPYFYGESTPIGIGFDGNSDGRWRGAEWQVSSGSFSTKIMKSYASGYTGSPCRWIAIG